MHRPLFHILALLPFLALVACDRANQEKPAPAAASPSTPGTVTPPSSVPPESTPPKEHPQLEPTLPSGHLSLDPGTPSEPSSIVTLVPAGIPFSTCPAHPGKAVVMTFDDGPSPYSNELLDSLAQAGVPAVFFLKGDNLDEGNPDLEANRLAVKRMHDEGHEICNHTFSHPNLTDLADADVVQEMLRAEDLIADVTGRRTRCMRPPYSAYDDRILGILGQLDYSVVMWSSNSKDWLYASTEFPDDFDPQKLLGAVDDALINATGPLIHIQHDNQFTKASVDMVSVVIDKMKQAGFEFVTLSACLGGALDVGK